MKLRLALLLLFLFGIGLFATPQDKKKTTQKPTVENGYEAIPVTVISHKKAHPALIKKASPDSLIKNSKVKPVVQPGKAPKIPITNCTGNPCKKPAPHSFIDTPEALLLNLI